MNQTPKFQRVILTIFIIAGLVLISTVSGVNPSEDLKAMLTTKSAFAAHKYGILGQTAPELQIDTWIDPKGQPREPVRLSHYRGKVVYLYFFQHW